MLTVAYFHLLHVIAIPAVIGLPQLPTRSPTDPKLLSFSSFFLARESGIFHRPPWSISVRWFLRWNLSGISCSRYRPVSFLLVGYPSTPSTTWPPSPSPISKHGARSSSVTGHQKIPVRSSSSASSSSWVSASSRYLPIVNGWHGRPSGRPMKCKRCTNRSASEELEEERAIMVSMGEDRRVIGGHCGRRLLSRRPDGR